MSPRFLLAAVALVLVAATGVAAAGPCKRKGTVIYREHRTPVVPATDTTPAKVPTVSIEVRSSGSWTRVQSGELGSNEALGDSGCLTRRQLAEVKRALRRARFEQAVIGSCDMMADTLVVMRGRGERVERDLPCGRDVDAATQRLWRCIARATDHPSASTDLRAACRDD